ncbi:MAG: ABC transporter substrate-binding protein [Chitinophagales bacterium]|nr:ABC transporter substrate-binding protein [Chitinophagales bacterium]
MKKYIIILLSFLAIACGSNQSSEFKLTKAKGDRYYGGTFRYNEEEYFKSLYPLNITEVTGHRIAEQIYEGLVKFNVKTLAIEPCIAKRWDILENGKVYIFHLRDSVYYHDDECFPNGKGRKVTAQDFKYCFDRLCFHDPANNQGTWIFQDVVQGANEYNEATANGQNPSEGVSGVQVINDSTLSITLEKPYAVFLARLGLIFAKVYPKEAVEHYGQEMRVKCVGTGPFYLNKLIENQVVFLSKNEQYWNKDEFGNQLPLLDNIKVTFIKEKKAELEEFKKGKSDLVYKFPLEIIDEIIDVNANLRPAFQQFQVQYMPSMSLQYYGFLHIGKIFHDKNVRLAFCYAVDREKLCKFTLKNTGFPAKYGVVPPGTGTYPSDNVKGFTYDPEKARKYLADAGFPNGKGFPKVTLQLNSGGSRNTQVAEAITKMIEETLNVEVDMLMVPWAQHTEAVEAAKVDFFRMGWIADYPDAENFLNLFHSKYVPDDPTQKTYINSYRFKDAKFDALFDKAVSTTDETERNKLYNQADQEVIDNAAVLPTYYDIDFRLLQPNVRNCPQNAMEYREFSEVYLVPKEKKNE